VLVLAHILQLGRLREFGDYKGPVRLAKGSRE